MENQLLLYFLKMSYKKDLSDFRIKKPKLPKIYICYIIGILLNHFLFERKYCRNKLSATNKSKIVNPISVIVGSNFMLRLGKVNREKNSGTKK